MPKHHVDSNIKKSIVTALGSHTGVSLFSMPVGTEGNPELILGYRGINVIIRVKIKKLNSTQNMWNFRWRGAPVVVLQSNEDAHRLIANIDAHYKHFGGILAQTLTTEDTA
jgi:hypothetical protein